MNETNTPPAPTPGTGSTPPEISYQVMPRAVKQYSQQPTKPEPQTASGGSGGKVAYIIIAIVVVLGLGAVAYYFLGVGKKTADNANPDSKLTQKFLQDNFAKDVCDDVNTCGDNADPDHDGLSNYQEFVAGTKATLADTDGDGLADGDEVNIYGTNPVKKYTDTRQIASQNDYNDGASIKNGYDPLTQGSKYTETALAQISMKISQFKLHAPTTTTLGLNEDGSKASVTR